LPHCQRDSRTGAESFGAAAGVGAGAAFTPREAFKRRNSAFAAAFRLSRANITLPLYISRSFAGSVFHSSSAAAIISWNSAIGLLAALP